MRNLFGLHGTGKGAFAMLVMPGDNLSGCVHYWAGAFPGKIGSMVSPASCKRIPSYLPYAVDNGAWVAYRDGVPWNPALFRDLLGRVGTFDHPPLWVAVPDVVGDPEATLRGWEKWAPEIGARGFRLAFVAQDGHEIEDIPSSADVVFVGGSRIWKDETTAMWCSLFPRVHVGRVNGRNHLWSCYQAGAESVDGTGWFRSGDRQRGILWDYMNTELPERRPIRIGRQSGIFV